MKVGVYRVVEFLMGVGQWAKYIEEKNWFYFWKAK